MDAIPYTLLDSHRRSIDRYLARMTRQRLLKRLSRSNAHMPNLRWSAPCFIAGLLLAVAVMPVSARHASKRWEQIESVRVDLRTIAPGEVKTVSWQGWQVIVLHRTTQQIRELRDARSEEHTSELQSLMRNSYAVFCLKKK